MWKFSDKRQFFRADTAGLGKYSMDGYGRIGVHRVNLIRIVVRQIKKYFSGVFFSNYVFRFFFQNVYTPKEMDPLDPKTHEKKIVQCI